MLKRLVGVPSPVEPSSNWDWLDLPRLAVAEISSEDAAHPFEGALTPGSTDGWRASTPVD